MYEGGAGVDALAAVGLTPEDFGDEDTVEVWPDCYEAVMLMHRLRTQWRVGMGGATGLDYNVAMRLIDQTGHTGQAWDDLLADLQVMEIEALAAMDDAREDAKP